MKLQRRLTKRLCIIGVIAIVLTAVSSAAAFWFVNSEQSKQDLFNYGDVAASYCNAVQDDYTQLNKIESDNYRVTVIEKNGKVVFESDKNTDIATMENHADRPEFIDAKKTGKGESSRTSVTLGGTTYYYALRLDNGDVLRVSSQINDIYGLSDIVVPLILAIVAYVFLVCVFLSAEFTKTLVKPIKDMAYDVENVGYEELVPIAQTIKNQKEEIRKQVVRIQEEKDRINTIIANMEEGMVLLDTQKNILMDNESAKKMLRLRGMDITGESIEKLCSNQQLLECIDAAAEGKSKSDETQIDGNTLQIMVNPVYSGSDQTGIICMVMNVTDRTRTEKMRREFTANVSHELKTPLTSISGYAEMIENGMAKDDDVKHFAARIHREAGRLVALISDIIKLSKLDDEQVVAEVQNVNMADIVKESAETLAMSAQKHQITLKTEIEDCIVQGENTGLYELVYNLCDNAIRYNKPNGTVNVTLKKSGSLAVLTVQDNGIGIDQKHLSRVFERFYRVDKSRSKETGGTGLGLAIVKHIAEQHHAQIDIESKKDVGTKITVIFNRVS